MTWHEPQPGILTEVYGGLQRRLQALCQELKLPQTALDILLFLVNNPEYKTASDIVEVRKLKANLVSVNVDRLVQEGYLRREPWQVTAARPCSSGRRRPAPW